MVLSLNADMGLKRDCVSAGPKPFLSCVNVNFSNVRILVCMGLTCLEDSSAGHGMLRVCWHSRRSEAHRSSLEARP